MLRRSNSARIERWLPEVYGAALAASADAAGAAEVTLVDGAQRVGVTGAQTPGKAPLGAIGSAGGDVHGAVQRDGSPRGREGDGLGRHLVHVYVVRATSGCGAPKLNRDRKGPRMTVDPFPNPWRVAAHAYLNEDQNGRPRGGRRGGLGRPGARKRRHGRGRRWRDHADALNAVFGTTAFRGGLVIGTETVTAEGA